MFSSRPKIIWELLYNILDIIPEYIHKKKYIYIFLYSSILIYLGNELI